MAQAVPVETLSETAASCVICHRAYTHEELTDTEAYQVRTFLTGPIGSRRSHAYIVCSGGCCRNHCVLRTRREPHPETSETQLPLSISEEPK